MLFATNLTLVGAGPGGGVGHSRNQNKYGDQDRDNNAQGLSMAWTMAAAGLEALIGVVRDPRGF